MNNNINNAARNDVRKAPYVKKLALAAAVSAAAVAGQAHAGGFQLNEQSVSGQGYGHAGRSSNVEDATIVYGNPAGMSFLDRAQVTAGGTYLMVDNDISNATADVNGSNDGDMVGNKAIPFAFYAHPVNDRLAFGFGVYAPFGSKTDYEDDFQGRYFGNYTEVKVMTAQPTVSYRFNDQWSVGAGVTYNKMEGELHRQVQSIAGDVDSRVDGDDEAWGYNVGVIYQPVPETTLGLTYRSEVEYELEGDFEATNPLLGVVASDNAYLELTTPETVNFSVTQQMSDKLKLMFGASWARWSKFQEIRVTGDTIDEITQETQNYSNSWAFAVGGEYQLNPQWALRAGLSLDQTPSNDKHRSVRIPSDDRRIFSLGAGWTPMDDLTVDLAYSYLTEHGTHVEQSRGVNTYSADYKNEAHGFGAQLTYRF
jgi:long-chain fatty acid transport protein